MIFGATPRLEFSMKLETFRSGFLDREAVLEKTSKAARRVMMRWGGFVRTWARRLLRRRKKVSPPGQPPSVHSRDKVANLKNILFAYVPQRESVVVGPAGLNQVNLVGTSRQTVPGILEQGGTVTIHEESPNQGLHWFRRDLRRTAKSWKLYRTRRATYEPRPFMGPAYRAGLAKLPEWLAGSVTRRSA